MKILAIGNSFSQDATALLEFLSPQLLVRNLYIPGCSLLLHSELSHTEKAEYEYQEGGANSLPRKVTLKEGLKVKNGILLQYSRSAGFPARRVVIILI